VNRQGAKDAKTAPRKETDVVLLALPWWFTFLLPVAGRSLSRLSWFFPFRVFYVFRGPL